MESFYGGVPGRNVIIRKYYKDLPDPTGGEPITITEPGDERIMNDPDLWYGDYYMTADGHIWQRAVEDPGYADTRIQFNVSAPEYDYIAENKELIFYNISKKTSNEVINPA